jgi:urease
MASYKLRKKIEAVKGCRTVTKRDLKHNDSLPEITVDPETYRVTADGVVRLPSSLLSVAHIG